MMFRTERDFVRGKCLPITDEDSFVLYAANRAGSMLLTRTLRAIGEENGFRHIDLERFFVHTDRERLSLLRDEVWLEKNFKKKGFFVGALRELLPGQIGESLRSIAVIRDPRDIVVSHYFAVTVGHTVFDQAFLDMKERAKAMTIDEYALDYGETAVNQALELWSIGKRANAVAVRYEDLLAHGGEALVSVAIGIGLPPPSQTLVEAFDADIRPSGTGDSRSHKRSGVHGQFLDQLKLETILEFERRHGEALVELGYELHGGNPTTTL